MPTTYVVTLSFRGAYKGMVGPFPSEGDAEAWAAVNAESAQGWAWDVEPVVTPEALATYVPEPRPFLRVVG